MTISLVSPGDVGLCCVLFLSLDLYRIFFLWLVHHYQKSGAKQGRSDRLGRVVLEPGVVRAVLLNSRLVVYNDGLLAS